MDRYVVTMPQLGESVNEGIVSRWLVQPGDRVAELDPLLEVQTDKVEAELPSPASGILREILAAEGSVTPVGAPLAVIEIDPTASDPTVAPPSAGVAALGGSASASPEGDTRLGGGNPPQATSRVNPAVRRLAEQNGLDLRNVVGSGAQGRVTRRDIDALLTQQRTGVTPAEQGIQVVPSPAESPLKETDGPSLPGDTAVALSPMRRRIAESMARSKATIPHAWQAQEVDMRHVVASMVTQRVVFESDHGIKLRYFPYVVAAAARALTEIPEVNVTFAGDRVIVHRQVNVGIAIGLPEGVLVPVVREANRFSIGGLARAIDGLVQRARTKTLSVTDLSGATFTVNNSGAFGTLLSYSVIHPGQAAILTMGTVTERPMAAGGRVEVSPMLYLSLSLDHRVMDGLSAARFLSYIRSWLENIDPHAALE